MQIKMEKWWKDQEEKDEQVKKSVDGRDKKKADDDDHKKWKRLEWTGNIIYLPYLVVAVGSTAGRDMGENSTKEAE